MNFLSQEFVVFFIITLTLWFSVKKELAWFVGVGASLYFYYTFSPWFPLLLVTPVILVFLLTRNGDKDGGLIRSRYYMALISGLGALLFYKFSGIAADTVRALGIMSPEELKASPLYYVLPAGLSFYTFRLVSYTADVYNGIIKPEKHPGNFALYIMYFPQLLAGPIERGKDFLPQLKSQFSFNPDSFFSGLQLFCWGMFKKMVVSERLLPYVDECFRNPTGKGIGLLFAAWFYSFIIYCDFSGYTDMAIGLARIMGIKSAENFNYPYLSRSITQFWNRWHISLSFWLRDYLFLPLSYAIMKRIKTDRLARIKTETWGYVGGMLITMILGGFWHGDKWTFIIWGLLHGLFLCLSFITKKRRKRFVKKSGLKKFPRLHSALNIFTTFNMVTLAWIFFYAEDIGQAYTFISKMGIKIPQGSVGHIIFNMLLVGLFLVMEYLYRNRHRLLCRFRKPEMVKPVLFALLVCLLIIFSVDKSNVFIYMRF